MPGFTAIVQFLSVAGGKQEIYLWRGWLLSPQPRLPLYVVLRESCAVTRAFFLQGIFGRKPPPNFRVDSPSHLRPADLQFVGN